MVLLQPLTEPYASIRVAVYEPLIVQWLSVPGLSDVLVKLLARQVPLRKGDVAGGSAAPTIARFDWRASETLKGTTGSAGFAGASTGRAAGGAASRPAHPAMHVRSTARSLELPAEEYARRRGKLHDLSIDQALTGAALLTKLTGADVPHLFGSGGFEQALSPVGVVHLYRQLYFDLGAGLGPIEHAFTVAPKEEMQVVQEVTRRESVERIETLGTESTLEKSAEESVSEEISDSVQTAIRRDMQVGVSASAEGSIGVWSGSAQGSLDLAQSSERATEIATTRSVSQTKKSSEVLRKSYSLTVKSFTEFSERSTIKRTIRNDGADPVNYGLRRVLRTVRVKLQALGSRLVWQLYVRRPGERLATSKLVMFRESDSATPGPFPGAPAQPPGGTDAGTQTVSVQREGSARFIELVVPMDPARDYTGLTVDSINDASPDKDSTAPGLLEATVPGQPDEAGRTWTYKLFITGSARVVNVSYTSYFQPSAAVLAEWSAQVMEAQRQWEAKQLEEAFERAKRIVVAKSRVRPRPPADLRDEERYEILNRMISEAFHDVPAGGLPMPVEIELFHRYFEIPAMFHYVHPSWWTPRYGAGREEYEITEDSEPGRFGKSLGWLIQLDGDRRRNEFLNSPWLRVCLPIRPGVEREALLWLAEHIEGRQGFSTAEGSPLGTLLADIEARREAERLAAPGPDYVTLDGEVPPSRSDSAAAYPIVDEFSVVVPTEGFIYDRIETG